MCIDWSHILFIFSFYFTVLLGIQFLRLAAPHLVPASYLPNSNTSIPLHWVYFVHTSISSCEFPQKTSVTSSLLVTSDLPLMFPALTLKQLLWLTYGMPYTLVLFLESTLCFSPKRHWCPCLLIMDVIKFLFFHIVSISFYHEWSGIIVHSSFDLHFPDGWCYRAYICFSFGKCLLKFFANF